MAYNKTTWVNNSSPFINETNLNNIENGIESAHNDIASLDNIVSGLVSGEIPQGAFTPTSGTPYPSPATKGYSWYYSGLDNAGFTYSSGDLNGVTVKNGDKIIRLDSSWDHIDIGADEAFSPYSNTTYHSQLVSGNLSLSAIQSMLGADTELYTGTGASQDIDVGIDLDTQWGNDSSERYGGLVWVKNRAGTTSHLLSDTINGVNQSLSSDTFGQLTAGGVSAFNNNGFSITSPANNHVSWVDQTTHRTSGTTNHGKPYTCHYNPYTGFTMVKYEGSGIAGHGIPHHLGRELAFTMTKNTGATADWSTWANGKSGKLNGTDTFGSSTSTSSDSVFNIATTDVTTNVDTNQYILYGYANSYYDNDGKLVGAYEIGEYVGTGSAGNEVTTRGKPAYNMIKSITNNTGWLIVDTKRWSTYPAWFFADTSYAEGLTDPLLNLGNNGFSFDGSTSTTNTAGQRYLYFVKYDTNANGGGAYYDKPSDTNSIVANNAITNVGVGVDEFGFETRNILKNGTQSYTYTEGENHVIVDKLGGVTISKYEPQKNAKDYNGFGYVWNDRDGKWYDGVTLTPDGNTDFTGHNVIANGVGKVCKVMADSSGNPYHVEHYKTESNAELIKADDIQTDTLKVTDGFDLGQQWVDVTAERIAGVEYINDTGKPIELLIRLRASASGVIEGELSIDGGTSSYYKLDVSSSAYYVSLSQTVPSGSSYSIVVINANTTIQAWTELR